MVLPNTRQALSAFLREKLKQDDKPHSGDEYADVHNLRGAAVLVGLILRPQGVQILLTQRAQHLAAHPGQISFPGGASEKGDVDLIETALRESQEEVGLDPRCVEVVGQLGHYHTISRYRVLPIVGIISEQATFYPDPSEVDSVFELPAQQLLNPSLYERRWVRRAEVRAKSHFLQCDHRLVWGATAGMLLSMARLLGVKGEPQERDDLEYFPK